MDILEKATSRKAMLQDRRRMLVKELERLDAELRDLDGFFKVASSLQERPEPVQGSVFVSDSKPIQNSVFVNGRPAQGGVSVSGSKPWVIPGQKVGDANEAARRVMFVPGNKTRVIVTVAQDIIQAHGALPARRILEIMDERGMGVALVPGKDEKGRVSYLSAVLSKDGRFASDRDKGGYVLVGQQEKAPQGGNQEGPNSNNGDDLV